VRQAEAAEETDVHELSVCLPARARARWIPWRLEWLARAATGRRTRRAEASIFGRREGMWMEGRKGGRCDGSWKRRK